MSPTHPATTRPITSQFWFDCNDFSYKKYKLNNCFQTHLLVGDIRVQHIQQQVIQWIPKPPSNHTVNKRKGDHHHHHLSSLDRMVEAVDTNSRQIVLFFMSCWISFGSRSRSVTMIRLGGTFPASLYRMSITWGPEYQFGDGLVWCAQALSSKL